MPQGLLAIESDVSGVPAVVPVCEKSIVGLEAGHDRQPAPRARQAHEPVEFFRGAMEVLHSLGAGHEVVSSGQRQRVRMKEGIV